MQFEQKINIIDFHKHEDSEARGFWINISPKKMFKCQHMKIYFPLVYFILLVLIIRKNANQSHNERPFIPLRWILLKTNQPAGEKTEKPRKHALMQMWRLTRLCLPGGNMPSTVEGSVAVSLSLEAHPEKEGSQLVQRAPTCMQCPPQPRSSGDPLINVH